MSNSYDELKRKIRKMKKLEMQIRFGGAGNAPRATTDLVWDAFFDLHENGSGKAKYSIHRLSDMSKEEYREAIGEFFFQVYYTYYKENGILFPDAYEPKILSQMGLPVDADEAAIKKRFHELALKFHPDTGGDAGKFMALMEDYRKLIEKGK